MLPGLALAALGALPAAAHLDPSGHGSFAAGFTHPVFGADHVLAMLAVGLWAALLGGRAIWLLPAGFLGGMGAGFALALAGMPLPAVEPVILASVVALGAAVALAARLPAAAAAAITAAFGLFHGHAHGAEIGGAAALAYLGGFTLATALLHGAGCALGLGAVRVARLPLLRLMGAAAALAGGALVLGG